MDTIKFPHRVKVDGIFYRAGEAIKVPNAEAYLTYGAVVVEKAAAAPKARATAKKTKKQLEAAEE